MFRLPFTFCALGLLLTSTVAWGQQQDSAPPAKALETNEQKASYIIGHNFASRLIEQGLTPDVSAIALGIADAVAGKDSRFSPEEAQAVMMALQKALAEKERTRMMELQKKNEAFLAENAKKEGVVTLPSGLQYKVVKQGTGAKPKETDTVTVHYEGKLIDGTIFDSSKKRNQPASFPLNRVIKGWTEGVQLMPVGSTYIFYIPGKLAYGKNPPPGSSIYPDAVLIFEVELLSIGEQK